MTDLTDWASQQAEVFSGATFTAIVPDPTRSGGRHVGDVLRGLYRKLGDRVAAFKVLIALGTHPPVSRDRMQSYLGFSAAEAEAMAKLEFINHAQSDLVAVGQVSREQWLSLSNGLMDLADFGLADGVTVEFNRHAIEADDVCIVGPVLPHEVVGCSGGFKYFTPGIGANELTGLTHWLGAVLTIPKVIGVIETPVRHAIEHCAGMINGPEIYCAALVVSEDELRGQFFGRPIEAHRQAAAETLRHNVVYAGRKYRRVVGCLPDRYDELWTGGKASYKLIQLVEPGGELIIYAPRLREVSLTWGKQILETGYHSKAYVQGHLRELLARGVSPAVLAHVTHVFGPGEWDGGRETPSVVHLAAGFDESFTRQRLNLGYYAPESLDFDQMAADTDTFIDEHAGERLVLPAAGP